MIISLSLILLRYDGVVFPLHTRGYVFQPIPEKEYENKNIVVYLAMETYVKASLNDPNQKMYERLRKKQLKASDVQKNFPGKQQAYFPQLDIDIFIMDSVIGST